MRSVPAIATNARRRPTANPDVDCAFHAHAGTHVFRTCAVRQRTAARRLVTFPHDRHPTAAQRRDAVAARLADARLRARHRRASTCSRPSASRSRRARRSCRRGAMRCPSRSARPRAKAKMRRALLAEVAERRRANWRGSNAQLAEIQERVRSIAARHAQPAARERTGGTFRSGQRRGASLGHAAHIRLSRRRITSTSAPRSAVLDFEISAKIAGLAFLRAERRGRAPASRARAIHARHAHVASTATPNATCPTSSTPIR